MCMYFVAFLYNNNYVLLEERLFKVFVLRMNQAKKKGYQHYFVGTSQQIRRNLRKTREGKENIISQSVERTRN